MKRILSLVTPVLLAIVLSACSVSTANITQAVLAKDVQGNTYEPVNPTTTFAPDQALIHLVVSVANVPSGTKVKAVWSTVDVGSAAPANQQLLEKEATMDASANVHFSINNNAGPWPVGKYKVDVYLNDKLDRTLDFTVAQ
jgi:hypothetical protein